jgi:hypothetical protein
MNQNEVITHGEAMIFAIASLPKSAKRIKVSNPEKGYHIIADSETTGNHHVVAERETTEFYMDEDGNMYMTTAEPTEVSCVHADRHSPIEIPTGTYEFGIQQEYDHFAQQQRNVAD